MVIYVTVMFSGSMPFMNWLAALSFGLHYWVEKYELLKVCQVCWPHRELCQPPIWLIVCVILVCDEPDGRLDCCPVVCAQFFDSKGCHSSTISRLMTVLGS